MRGNEMLLSERATATVDAHRPRGRGGALVGRAEELAALEGRLRDPGVRLLTLIGPAGVGKSRLAAAAAHAVTSPGAPPVPGDVFDAVRTPDPAGPGSVADAAAELARVPGRSLLVLDGCDHELRPSADAVAALLDGGPGITVLATALEPLGVYGEQLVPVAPLPVPRPADREDPHALARVASVELFLRRAAEARAGFALTEENAGDVADLCVLLEGLPLALELAAARCRSYPPRSLLSRIRRRPVVLSGGPATAPERHRSLAALAAWGCRGLTAGQHALLRRLSMYEPGFGPVAFDRPDEEHLDALLDRGVLALVPDGRPGEPGYTVPEPYRSYGRDTLETEGRLDTAADDHADRYARLVSAAAPRLGGTDQAHWLGVLAAETPNVLAALDRLCHRGDEGTAAATALAFREVWLARGLLREGTARCDRLAQGGRGVPEATTARLLDLSGELAAARGDASEAVRRHRAALALCKRLGDRRQTALVTAHLGAALLADGDAHGALAALEPSAATLESLGAAGPAARTAVPLAGALHALGRSRKAREALDRAREELRRLGDGRGLVEALARSAELGTGPEQRGAADGFLREALSLCAETGELTLLPYVLELFALHVLDTSPAQQPRVVRLIAGAEGLRERLGTRAPEPRRAALREALDGLRARLGRTAFSTARAEGLALDADAAVREALSAPAPARGPDDTPAAEKQSLTPRQIQVAMLVSEGLTNRQIAARLGLSEWTVVNHVRQVMRRLDCSSRVQVAWAIGKWA
ncbi:ATP-binding protein [Streptomyces vietnamensis]|uniref:ATP-binding protein n=1 Tax=Streptomyces vietnamensis TaxID=362257 RepID=UPI00379FE119